MGFFSRLFTGAKNALSSVWNKVKDGASTVWNATKPIHGAIWSHLKPLVKEVATAAADKLPGPLAGVAKTGISHLRQGGKVHSMQPTVQGGTHAYVMHDGVPQNSFQR